MHSILSMTVHYHLNTNRTNCYDDKNGKKQAKWNHHAKWTLKNGEEKNAQSKLDIDRHRDDDVQNDIWTTMKLNKATLKRIKNIQCCGCCCFLYFSFNLWNGQKRETNEQKRKFKRNKHAANTTTDS